MISRFPSSFTLKNLPEPALTFTDIPSSSGAISITSFNVNVTNSIFTNNSAAIGGALSLYSSTGNITNCVFSLNSCGGSITNPGGTIAMSDSQLQIISTNFTGNNGNLGQANGAAIQMTYASASTCNSLYISNSTFTQNSNAIGTIAALYYEATTTINVKIENSNFINNYVSVGSIFYTNWDGTSPQMTLTMNGISASGNNYISGNLLQFDYNVPMLNLYNCSFNNNLNGEFKNVVFI